MFHDYFIHFVVLCPRGLPFGTGGLKLTRSKNLLIALCARKRLSRNHQMKVVKWCWIGDIRFGTQFSLLWPCLFFVTPLIFGDESKIADSVDFEQQ